MFEILKTNFSEVTFVDGKIKNVYLISDRSILQAHVKPVGDYAFEVTDIDEDSIPVLAQAFRAPYYEGARTVVKLTKIGINKMHKMMEARRVPIQGVVPRAEDSDLFIMHLSDDESIQCLSAMPAHMIAAGFRAMMKNDPNIRTAINIVMMEMAMESLSHILDTESLNMLDPINDTAH